MMENNNKTDLATFDESYGGFSVPLLESINNIIRKEGYVKYEVKKKLVPQHGNFLSFLYEVDITGETAAGEKETALFIKKIITPEKITLASIPDLYSRERFVYKDLSILFLRLQDAANIPDKERFNFLKRYDSDNDTIIMENLSKQGFKTHDETQVVSIRSAELSIIALAKFHAMSYVIKKELPEYFDNTIRALSSPFNLDSDWEGFIHNICAVSAEVVEGEAKEKIKNYAPRMIKIYREYIKNNVPTNGCLCHGDYKILNILVKEVDGEASEVKPIDYQLVYYGNPVNDFLFYMYTGTDREFRRKHLSYLKDLYFENFAEFLKYFKMNVNSTYSRQEFENDLGERLELGLIFGLYLCAFTFAHVEEGFNMSKLSLCELPIVPDKLFADRVRGIVDDCIDWDYL